MWCIVNLPNGTQQAVKWDPKANGQECLEKVCKALGIICEMEYFGLEHWTPNQKESRSRQWINLRNRLSCDSGSNGIQLMLALRVKFWVPVHTILQESVRNLFYMQAKVDLLEGRLNARDWTNAAKLAALLCQADGIRFNETSVMAKCPIRMRNEQDLMLKMQQQSNQYSVQQKERKEKEHVLSFKKRRLSKQKSVDHTEQSQQQGTFPLNASNMVSVSSPFVSRTSSINTTSNCTSLTNPSNISTKSTLAPEGRLDASPLCVYQDYVVRPSCHNDNLPENFLREIAIEHGKLAKLKMAPSSAKYWLLQEIQGLDGFGEELFSGVTTNENATRCDIAVGAHGIKIYRGVDGKHSIPFSAITAAKSFRRTFKLEYVDDDDDRKDLEIKLYKHAIAAGLYRSITERHAFYVCDKVRGVVTNQFTRDLKGTIASMFKEDTELGKRYVFDIQHTCREVHDQARRILHERGIEVNSQSVAAIGDFFTGVEDIFDFLTASSSPSVKFENETIDTCGNRFSIGATCLVADKLDFTIREKEAREAAIERCVETRISEAMTCKICMDRPINTMFNPCCHVITCAECAARCTNCPNCRVRIINAVKIYLPPELRTNQPGSYNSKLFNNSSNVICNSTDSPTIGTDPIPTKESASKVTGAA